MLSEEDYSRLVADAMQELRDKMQAHLDWGIDRVERWELDPASGYLIFLTHTGVKAVCPAQVIGTLDSQARTWAWAWADPAVGDALKQDAFRVHRFGEDNELWPLTTDVVEADEEFAWYMTALAARLGNARGAYRGPVGEHTSVFLTFSDVQLLDPAQPIPPRENNRL
jgi:hypothetical protein